MTDHPSTFQGDTAVSGVQAWDDRAAIVPAGEDTNLSGAATPLMRGTFAEMIRHITRMSEDGRHGYVIEKAGDRSYDADEAMALASHPDFPAQGKG